MTLANELKKLQELLSDGLITQEMFEEERDRLLAARRGGSGEKHPTSIGAYRLGVRIGEGGMGAVYQARHTQSGVARRQGGDVAIKVMHDHHASRDDLRARFERESDLGLRLDHANIVKVHDLVVDAGRLAMVMEWVEGRPLSDLIGAETGPIPWERARPLVDQLLDGVEHAHAAGVVHRDLKPDNIMVTATGEVKILDFGIAKLDDAGATKTGTGLGTIAYMAPEQYLDAKRVDRRADIYALGMTLYEMLAGRLPWSDETSDFEVLTRKSTTDLPPPTAYYPGIPLWVVQAVAAAMAVAPDDRPSDIGSLRRLLRPGVDASVPARGAPASRTMDEPPSPPEPVDRSGLPSSRTLAPPPPSAPQPAKGADMGAVLRITGVLAGGVGLVLALLFLVLATVRSAPSTMSSPPLSVETPEAPPTGLTRYVSAATSSNLRTSADVESAVITKVLRGDKVIIVGPSVGRDTFSGVTGGWAPVWVDGQRGYLFDAFLFPYPTPPSDCADLERWAKKIGHAGAEILVGRETCANLGISSPGDCDRTVRTPLTGGGYIEQNSGWEWGSVTLYLPGVGRDALWAAARNCFRESPDMRGRPLPRQSGPARLGLSQYAGATAVVNGSTTGWEWSEGCSAWLHVSTDGANAMISAGSGC